MTNPPVLEAERSAILSDVRTRVGENFESAWETGHSMSYDEAVEFALETIE